MAIDTTPTVPTTLLEAVNTLLNAARVRGIVSLESVNLNVDAAAAKSAIDMVIREALMPGFEFNTEREVKIDPEVSGEINLPNNPLKVKSYRWQWAPRLVRRGNRLYDPKKRTYAIGETVTVDIVVALEFAELPPAAKAYVTAVAARRFALPRLPEGATFQYTEEYLRSALAAMEQEDADVEDSELKLTSPHFANMGRR